MLPLDEPTFNVDANTREISVPDVFRKNGVGVQGDQLAETLFFTIDRYFDTTDLYRDDIKGIIQWETAPSGKQFETGYSPIAFKDVKIVKDKMVFGWFLNNTITSNPGTVKFSVRFFSVTEDTDFNNNKLLKLDFSLSTKTQTITINPAISYSINNESGLPEVNPYDDLYLITKRFKDSVYPEEASSEVPEFTNLTYGGIFGDDLNIFEIEVKDNDGNVIETVNASDLNKDLKLELLTKAISSDAGKISYKWYRKDLDNSVRNIGSTPVYVKTKDVLVNSDKDYYVKITVNGGSTYKKAEGLEAGELFPEEYAYYELYNGVTVNTPGEYFVEAINRKKLASSSIKSGIIRVPGPGVLEVVAPEFNGNFLNDAGVIELEATGSANEGDTISYKWYSVKNNGDLEELDSVDGYWASDIIDEEDWFLFDEKVKVVVTATRNGMATAPIEREMRITHRPYPLTVTAEKESVQVGTNSGFILKVEAKKEFESQEILSDSIKYQWYKKTEDPDDNDEKIVGATNPSYVSATPSYESGVFYCKVTNEVNGDSIDANSPEILVVRI